MSDRKGSARIPRIGILSPATEPGMRDWWRELVLGLREFGYVEGSNIELVWRFADGRFERLTDLAAELSQVDVDIVMPATPPAILAAKSVFPDIPIVFPLGSDPVETGLVSSVETARRQHYWDGNHVVAAKPLATGTCARNHAGGAARCADPPLR
jgi:ABC-type uncharacterized transport system substrate-binding protein